MFRNTLFTKLLFLLIIGSALLISGTYYLAIPLIDQRIYELEERAGKSALDNFYVLLQQTKQDLAAVETYSLNSHKEKLKDIVNIASTCLDRIQTTHNQGNLTLEEARAEAIAQIRSFKYSHNDYLYISDYNGNLIYHPDPNLNGTNISELKDINGKLIILPMITKAKICADVFYDYWWNRLGEKKPSHKLTYAKDLPRWGWVLFSGVHLDDIHNEVDVRKEKLIGFLREHVRSSKIATEGYLYVFDGNLNMVIHPNSNIEGTNFSSLKNPVSGDSLGKELIEVTHSGTGKLKYKWDKLSDPGHYIYDKIAWVRYLPEYDYYIASSVYLEDLQSSGKYLANRLFQLSFVTILLLTICGLALIYNVVKAVKTLAAAANRIVSGDLNSKVIIDRHDEIGQLGHSFNQMVDNLKDQINNLEQGVEERTASLSLMVDQLEQHNAETSMLKEANEMLQECRNEKEVFQAVHLIMKKAFPGQHGSLFSLVYEGKRLEIVADWNCTECNIARMYDHDACFAMRRGSSYVLENIETQLPCPHVASLAESYICTPITAYGETFGILHLQHGVKGNDQSAKVVGLVENIAENTANTMANLRLRSRLQHQSIRDPLTGLFNRRYMDEALHQEESRASRNDSNVAIIMMDVDHFKRFNDNYGHEAGDEILQNLGKLLHNHFRESDITCRYGGEEFIVILPDLSLEQSVEKAELLRLAVQDEVYIYRFGEKIGITISLGVALFPTHEPDVYSVLKRADEALYRAKERGRNRVVCANAE